MTRGRRITQLEPLDQRVQLMVTASELAAIDAWLAANRLRGRSEAIRQLIARGLEADDLRDRVAAEGQGDAALVERARRKAK